jgi:thiosulfate reductase cytochrome b subunit
LLQAFALSDDAVGEGQTAATTSTPPRLYAPLEAQLRDAVRFVVLPVLVMTGIAMWQAPRIRRLRKSMGRTRALAEPGAE